jgi:hypothetical protein
MVMILPCGYKENALISLHFLQHLVFSQVSNYTPLSSSKKRPDAVHAGRF